MLLGQLFYFEKELSKMGVHSNMENFLSIEIAAVTKNDLINLKGDENLVEFTSKVKELFIQNYLNLLVENQLYTTVNVWKLLTSAVKVNSDISTNSDFQKDVLNWIETDGEIKNLHSKVLSTGSRSTTEEDFALYYGLHVLYKIYLVGNTANIENTQLNLPNNQSGVEVQFNNLPEIIVIANGSIKPFVENLDCIFIDSSNSKQDILKIVDSSLSTFESVKLLIIDSQDEDLLHKIKKVNTKNILVTELNFSASQENNFFDILVKQTLGINLN